MSCELRLQRRSARTAHHGSVVTLSQRAGVRMRALTANMWGEAVSDSLGTAAWIGGIEKRAQLFNAWRADLAALRRLAARDFYVRVGGAGYRPVSLSPFNPCGRLCRKGSGAVIGSAVSMSAALSSAEEAEVAEFYRPRNAKPEHQMQAALIRHALMNDLSLHDLADGFSDVIDELVFVTDELAAGHIRADIIALGGMQGRYFPVFIELKAVRALGRLIKQLEAARNAMKLAGDSFLQLLENATGKPRSCISFDDAQLLIIWPESPSGREMDIVAQATAGKFLVATYAGDSGRFERARGK